MINQEKSDLERQGQKGGKCIVCGSSNTEWVDSGAGWGCKDCGGFTEK